MMIKNDFKKFGKSTSHETKRKWKEGNIKAKFNETETTWKALGRAVDLSGRSWEGQNFRDFTRRVVWEKSLGEYLLLHAVEYDAAFNMLCFQSSCKRAGRNAFLHRV